MIRSQFGGILPVEVIVERVGRLKAPRASRIMEEGAAGERQPISAVRTDDELATIADLMTNEPHSDEVLFEAYRAGDRGAFHELMRRYANELLHFLARYLGSRVAADDVFQETFLQVHLSQDTFDTSRRFKPWLFTIAANKARDYHRKHSRRSGMSLSSTIAGDDDSRAFVDLMEADIPSPDSPLVDSERSRLVKTVVDSMPSHLREILLLSYFQQLSYNQIAETLEIPLGTVKSRLHTAVASFARAWKAARAESESREGHSDGKRES